MNKPEQPPRAPRPAPRPARPHAPSRQRQREQQDTANLLPGRKPVYEMLTESPARIDVVFMQKGRKSRETDRILDACRAGGVRFQFVPEEAINKLFSGNHQGVLARLAEAGFVSVEDVLEAGKAAPLPVLLALDHVQDPHNVGALARTLYGLGGGGILLPKHNAAYLGPGVAKSSAGTITKLPIARDVNLGRTLEQAKDTGYWLYAAQKSENATSVHTLSVSFPAVLVLGGEAKGVRPSIANACDGVVEIPLKRDLDSLNVAQAGAIILGRLAGLAG